MRSGELDHILIWGLKIKSVAHVQHLPLTCFSQHRMAQPTHTVTCADGASKQHVFIVRCVGHVSCPHTHADSNVEKVYGDIPYFTCVSNVHKMSLYM